jgi:hypothetical protein
MKDQPSMIDSVGLDPSSKTNCRRQLPRITIGDLVFQRSGETCSVREICPGTFGWSYTICLALDHQLGSHVIY